LKFNRPFEKCGMQGERAMRFKSVLKRLFDKIVHDALPAGLASILGGLLLTHFHIDRAPQPTTVKVTPASPEMMQLLRDEHGLIVDFVREQATSEKSRAGADREPQHSVAETTGAGIPDVASTLPVPRPNPAVALAPPKVASPRSKNPVVTASMPPTAAPAPAVETAAQPTARADDSLLAKTMGIKDRVISATQHAVSATIGVIPSWFGSVGDRVGGEGQSPRPPADLINASWIGSATTDR
jgi:hypothetical protein